MPKPKNPLPLPRWRVSKPKPTLVEIAIYQNKVRCICHTPFHQPIAEIRERFVSIYRGIDPTAKVTVTDHRKKKAK
jgi:hypothetical protein